MKKYEAPNLELLNMARDIITFSGLFADLDAAFDAIGRDMFSTLDIEE